MTPDGRAMASDQEAPPTITTEEAAGVADLLPNQVTALAGHDDVSERDGPRAMRRMICEDMRHALGPRTASRARDLGATPQRSVAARLELVGGR